MRLYNDDPKSDERRPLYGFLLLTLGVGATASLFTEPNIATWYADLVRPAIAPPNWVFAPVWTTLYLAMGFAAWRVWRVTGLFSPVREAQTGEIPVAGPRASEGRGGKKMSTEMLAFGLQLFLNFCWSGIFFGLHQIGPAFYEIALLDLTILYTLLLFWRRDRLAGLLFLPYLAWVSFAALLNYRFWALNG